VKRQNFHVTPDGGALHGSAPANALN